jgi:uncharacterized membrane protein YbhN (UPF0104 family)
MTDSQPQTPDTQPVAPVPVQVPQPASDLAIASMILGIIAFTGPGLLLGIPAIVMARVDMNRHTPKSGFAVAGFVTGIISTVLSLLVIVGIIFVFLQPNPPSNYYTSPSDDSQTQKFESSEL